MVEQKRQQMRNVLSVIIVEDNGYVDYSPLLIDFLVLLAIRPRIVIMKKHEETVIIIMMMIITSQ